MSTGTLPLANDSAFHRDSFSQPNSGNYGLSTNQAFQSKQNPRTSQNDISQKDPFRLFPRDPGERLTASDDPPISGIDPYGQKDIGSNVARMGSAPRVKSYEDRHGREEVTTTIASSRKPAPGRSLSGTQPPMSVSEGKKVETTADPLSHLSRLGQIFIEIEYGQYGTCQNFIKDYPDILRENLANFQLEAVRLERHGKLSMVRNCVQQLLLIRGCLSRPDNEYHPFLSRMKNKDPETLKGFLVDFDKTLLALRQRAAAGGPIQSVKSAGREPPQSTNKGLSGVPLPRHAPEMRHRDGADNELSVPFKAVTIESRHRPEQHGSHWQAGNKGMMPPPSRTATDRRLTLGSVDEDTPLHVQSDTNSQAGDVSIADAELDIRGSAGEREELDHRYQKRLKDANNFFVVGKVFAMLWHEGAGDKKHGPLSQVGPYKVEKYDKKGGKYREEVFSHIRRMAVVKARHGYCWCIPINTYSYQGVAKKGLSDVDRQAHAIIYMDDTKLAISSKEKGMMFKTPIAVTATNSEQKLHVMSRINFGKVYSVEWNVKVMPVGRVNAQSMAAFTGYWHNEVIN